MRGMIKREDKRGEADSPIFGTVIFTILNLAFFILLLTFVWRSANGAAVYEEIYAKQIALAIDKAKPGTQIVINVDKGLQIADKNRQPRSEIFKIDSDKGQVAVSLSEGKGGYEMSYFNNYGIITEINNEGNLIITVK